MNLRNFIFWSHLVSGIVIGLLILIVSVTGMILAFEPQVLNIAERHLKSVAIPMDQPYPLKLNALIKKIQIEHSEIDPVVGVIVSSDPHATAQIQYGKKNRQSIYVNPYTAAIVGYESGLGGFFKTVEGMHRWFGFDGEARELAHTIKNLANFIFLLMILSGLYLWWPRKSFKLHNHLKDKARYWNQHNVFGIWSLPFLLVIVGTGFIMSLPSQPPQAPKHAQVKQMNMEQLLVIAQAKVPGWSSISLQIRKPDMPINVMITEKKGQWIPKRSRLIVGEKESKVVALPGFKAWIKYLHTGEAGKLPGQIAAFASSASAMILILTGFAMAWFRFFKKMGVTNV